MIRRGKKYLEKSKLIEPKKAYGLSEAIDLLVQTPITKFDSTCEVHFNLNADPKYADQIVRSTVSLPHGIGKEIKVIAFVPEDKVKEALEAGAIKAGEDDLIEQVNKGFLDFDMAVATPDLMRKLGKIAKILGPKGLMPNPKSGTVTDKISKTIHELKTGKIEFKMDKAGNVHSIFGKVSFGQEKLLENLKTFLKAVRDCKPSGIKGNFIQTITLATTMGPGIKIDVNPALAQLGR